MNRSFPERVLLCVAFALLVSGSVAAREFPGDPDSGLRQDTPNDPGFDCFEADDEDAAACSDLYGSQFRLFGFAPDASENTAIYREGPLLGQPQVSGVSADRAWKYSTGSPEVTVAILDTGVQWKQRSIRRKIWLNTGELPLPRGADGVSAPGYDLDGDGAVTVDDYADDDRVGDRNDNGLLDAQDLILAFSNGDDADGNGYIDDISGWDFLENDNDPADTSSYSSARHHGTGRAREAAEETNDGQGDAGICPQCRLMMLRTFDVFVMPGDNWAAGTIYAVDNGAQVEVVANGLLQNTRTGKAVNAYAAANGMALMHVSSDLNTANHNYPTNYVESIFINGCVADAPAQSGNEITAMPGLGDAVGLNLAVPIQTWFRQANLTQHGAHAHVCFVGDTGSQATGQAGGAAGLLHSLGLDMAGRGDLKGGALSANEVKQLLTMTAEDVLPLNTVGLGIADPAQEGWDEHFGYGRAHLGQAMQQLSEGRVPPEAQIETPAWWAMLDPVQQESIEITGFAAATRSGECTYSVEWATGVEPANDSFELLFADRPCVDKARGRAKGLQRKSRVLATLPLGPIADQLPGSREGQPPQDPNEFVVTVRLRVSDADGNVGEDRKTWFVYHDPSWHDGWPRFVDTGGETSPVLYDLDGNGTLEIIEANSSGELTVLEHDGRPLASFNDGKPWLLAPTYFYHPQSRAYREGDVPPPTSGFRTPAVADLDRDGLPELVVAAGDGRLFVLDASGRVRYTAGVDPALSTREKRDAERHPKAGFLGAPVVADLDNDGSNREIIAAGLDGHIYAWNIGETLTTRPGFPVKLADPDEDFRGGELIATPAVGQLDDDRALEIVSGSNEVYGATQPSGPGDLKAAVQGLASNLLANAIGGSSRIYAIHDNGDYLAGWPVKINGVLPDVLPLVGPQHAVALADFDGDGKDSVIASITTGDIHKIEPDGSMSAFSSTGAVNGGASSEVAKVLNLFEYAVIGDLNGFGGLDIASGGITSGGVFNLLLTGQNLPQNHVVQAWDSLLPEQYLPGYPRATDDYQLLSTPAIADVDGSGFRELVVGTGLYLLHAYNIYGEDAAGFPKLTGGWLYNVPAIGDIDADGKLEMVAGTREGWRFVWDLDAPATASSNSDWWTEAHDECHSNNHGFDCRPPSAVSNVTQQGNQLAFTATGGDWMVGKADYYEMTFEGLPAPVRIDALQGAGAVERIALPAGAGLLRTIVAVDDAGNRSIPAQPSTSIDSRPNPSP